MTLNSISILMTSLTCTGVCVVILLIRKFFGKYTGTLWRYLVWTLVLLRLLLPMSFVTPIGLIDNHLGDDILTGEAYIEQSNLDSTKNMLDEDVSKVDIKGDTSIRSKFVLKSVDIKFILSLLYLVGLVIAITLFLMKLIIQNRLISNLKPCTNKDVLDSFMHVKEKMNVKKNIAVLIDEDNVSPALCGLFKPSIILPKKSLEGKDSELKHIFIHELTHYRQNDLIKLIMLECVLCLHWFNIVLHLIKPIIVQDIELTCDEKSLSKVNGVDFIEYSQVIAQYSTGLPVSSSVVMTSFTGKNVGALKERLVMISQYNRRRSITTGIIITLCMILILLSCTTLTANASYLLDSNYPASFNWVDEGVVRTPENQGVYGGGSIFATIGIFESMIARETGLLLNLSEQDFINNSVKWSSDKGGAPDEVFEFLVDQGVVEDHHMRYTGIKVDQKLDDYNTYKLSSWCSVVLAGKSKQERIDIIKQTIYNNGPIVTNIGLFDDLYRYEGGIYKSIESSKVLYGHWVTIVGWKDDDSITSGGYWIVKESWGPNWGEEGFCRIVYSDDCGIDDYIIYYVGKPVSE